MRSVQKFLFETSFDDDVVPMVVEPPAPEPPTFDEAELVAARAEGFEAGRAAARAEAEASDERRRTEALASIAAGIGAIEPEIAKLNDDATSRAARLALAVARRLVPEYLQRHGTAEIEALLRDSLRNLLGEARVVLRVPDGDLDTINEHLAKIATRSGYAGRVVLIADDELGPGECRIEWADGGVERDTARLWREIELAAARVLGHERDQEAD